MTRMTASLSVVAKRADVGRSEGRPLFGQLDDVVNGERAEKAKRGNGFVSIDQRKADCDVPRLAFVLPTDCRRPCPTVRVKYKPPPAIRFPELSSIFSFYSHYHVAYISVQPNASRRRPQVYLVILHTRGSLSHIFLSSFLFFLPLASALSNLQVTSSNPSSGGSVTITWTADSTDPSTFSLELANNNFHNTFALANNVQTSSGTITVTLPIVSA